MEIWHWLHRQYIHIHLFLLCTTQVSQKIQTLRIYRLILFLDFCGISRRMREPYEKAAAFYRERIPHGNHTIDKFHVSSIGK